MKPFGVAGVAFQALRDKAMETQSAFDGFLDSHNCNSGKLEAPRTYPYW